MKSCYLCHNNHSIHASIAYWTALAVTDHVFCSYKCWSLHQCLKYLDITATFTLAFENDLCFNLFAFIHPSGDIIITTLWLISFGISLSQNRQNIRHLLCHQNFKYRPVYEASNNNQKTSFLFLICHHSRYKHHR